MGPLYASRVVSLIIQRPHQDGLYGSRSLIPIEAGLLTPSLSTLCRDEENVGSAVHRESRGKHSSYEREGRFESLLVCTYRGAFISIGLCARQLYALRQSAEGTWRRSGLQSGDPKVYPDRVVL